MRREPAPGTASPPTGYGPPQEATQFPVECYVPRTDAAAVALVTERAQVAAAELSRHGAFVRFLRTIFVPEDETCFYLFEAFSADAVEEAARRAGAVYQRVAAAVADPGGVDP